MTHKSQHEQHKKHVHHEHHEERPEEKPERRSIGEFVEPGEEVKHHPPTGGPGGGKTMPIGTPARSITPESVEEEKEE